MFESLRINGRFVAVDIIVHATRRGGGVEVAAGVHDVVRWRALVALLPGNWGFKIELTSFGNNSLVLTLLQNQETSQVLIYITYWLLKERRKNQSKPWETIKNVFIRTS